jgi:glycosyltransferase involved in cell wall biosynthesis
VGAPRVSVIIPVRDQPAFLGEALASVFRQAFQDIEVIVVDDGSSVDLGPALAPYAQRIRLERQPPTGVAAARNRGVACAQAPILAFHDADDLMEAGRISALLPRLEADPAIEVVFGNGVSIDAGGRLLGPVIPPRQARRLVRRGARLDELMRRSLVYLQGSLIRRGVVEELGGFPLLAAGSDWWFFLRCAARRPIPYEDAVLFRYRQHGASITAARVRSAEAAVTVLRELAVAEPRLLPQVGRRRWARALARRLARLAEQERRAGDVATARRHLREAVALAPHVVKYRVRLLRGPRA